MSELLKDKLFEKLKAHERPEEKFYQDKNSNATIGVGYTPVVKGEGGVWKVRPEVESDFKTAGVPLTKAHKQAFEDLAYAKNNPTTKDAASRQKSAMDQLGDININEKQAKALSGRLINESIAHAEKTLGKDRFDKLDEGFALGRLQTLAEKPQIPEDLAKQTRGIFGPLYGSQQTGNDHAVALQAGLNAIGPKYQDDWQPLKLDGDIGPKTTNAFNSLVHNAGPMALSEGIGSFLGWLA